MRKITLSGCKSKTLNREMQKALFLSIRWIVPGLNRPTPSAIFSSFRFFVCLIKLRNLKLSPDLARGQKYFPCSHIFSASRTFEIIFFQRVIFRNFLVLFFPSSPSGSLQKHICSGRRGASGEFCNCCFLQRKKSE